MTLGRVTQLPASRGQAGYRAQAMFRSRRALANEVGMPLVLLGRGGGENSASLRFASDATAVTALVIACRLYPRRESLGAQSPDPR